MAKKKPSLADYNASPLAGLAARKARETEAETEAAPPLNQAGAPTKETKQISAYIPKELHRDVKRALADTDGLTLTDLLIQLLSDWVKKQQ